MNLQKAFRDFYRGVWLAYKPKGYCTNCKSREVETVKGDPPYFKAYYLCCLCGHADSYLDGEQ